MPLQAICMTVCLFLAQVAADTGLFSGVHFVMERHPDSYFCGHLQCDADLTNSDHSVSSLIEMTVYDITRVNSELKLASVSAFHPDLYVDTTKSSAMSCTGIISTLQANLTLQLRHDIDCLYGVYKCQLDLITKSEHLEVLTEIVVPENNHSYSRVAEVITHIDTLTGLFNIHTTKVSNQTAKINNLESQLDDVTTQLRNQTTEIDKLGSQIDDQKTQLMDQASKIIKLGSQLDDLTSQLMNQTVEINNLRSYEDHQTTTLTEQTDHINKLGSQLDDLTSQLMNQTVEINNLRSHENHQTTTLTEQTDQINKLGSQLDDLTTKLADQTALLHNMSQRFDLERTEQKQMHDAVVKFLKTQEEKLETHQQPGTQTTDELKKQVPCYRGMPSTDNKRTIIKLWNKTLALCDTYTDCGGWVVIMKLTKGSVDLHQPWNSYKNGFGDPNTDHWIGNDVIHNLTSQGFNEFRIDLEDNGKKYFGQWSNFSVADEQYNYRMTVHGEMFGNVIDDKLKKTNGSMFMTFDRATKSNCPSYYGFGFWFGEDYCRSNADGRREVLNMEVKVRHA